MEEGLEVPELYMAAPVKELCTGRHFLQKEVQAARDAVTLLDHNIGSLSSFEEKAMELLEEAHRALSRVEQAVATAAAVEYIVVACEIKVACHRGLQLFRTYGRHRLIGKLMAIGNHGSVSAKFDAVISRLTCIMPTGSTNHLGSASGSSANGGSMLSGSNTVQQWKDDMESTVSPDGNCSTPSVADKAASTSSTAAHSVAAAAAGAWCSIVKGGSCGSSGDVLQRHIEVRGNHRDRIRSVGLAQPSEGTSAAPGVWWATSDKLETYSNVTQSITSFAAPPLQAAGSINVITLDKAGNVWLGTTKGSVTVRQRTTWEQLSSDFAFGSCVRCLAADADSNAVWGGDEDGKIAVFKVNNRRLECTATILAGRLSTIDALRGRSAPVLADAAKPKARSFLLRRRTNSCQQPSDALAAEGPIRSMLVRDDRAWVSGGRVEPWLALFDAVQGTELDRWSCGSYGNCMSLTALYTAAAVSERAAAPCASRTIASRGLNGADSSSNMPWSVIQSTVHEDGVGENPRSSWRLVSGHRNGQLLLWDAASDVLQPLVLVGESGSSPVKAVAALEQQGLLAVAHLNGELVIFNRPLRDEDWMLAPSASNFHTMGAAQIQGPPNSTCGSRRPSACSAALPTAASASTAAAAAALPGKVPSFALQSQAALTTIKPRRVMLRLHRCSLAAAAACCCGVVTASSLGAIKLWTAEALGREAERLGLQIIRPKPSQLPPTADSLASHSIGGLSMSQQTSSVLSGHLSRHGSPALAGAATDHFSRNASVLAVAAAAAANEHLGRHLNGMPPEYHFREVPIAPRALQSHQPSSMPTCPTSPRLPCGWPPNSSEQRVQHVLPACNAPSTAADGVLQQLQHQPWQPASQQQQPAPWPSQQQQSQEYCFDMAGHTHGAAHGALSVGTVSLPTSCRNSATYAGYNMPQHAPEPIMHSDHCFSAPLSAVSPAKEAYAVTTSRTMPLSGVQQPEFGKTQTSPMDSGGSLSAATHGGFMAGSGVNNAYGAAGFPAGGFAGSSPAMPQVIAAPRAPRALRDEGLVSGNALSRERRKSERRLSRGSQMQWSSCQMISSSELKLFNSIGSGAYGKVWLAEWMGTQVAVKELVSFQDKAKDAAHKRQGRVPKEEQVFENDSDSDSTNDSGDSIEEEVQRELQVLMSEVFLLGSLTHPSIIRFCALCLDPPMIVMQYYPHGSMYELLKRGRRGEKRALQELTWSKRLEMLRDVASGMVFLHSRRPPIVHGDLRSPNLLLDYTVDKDKGRYHVKIADFGLARMLGPNSSIAVSKVTNPRWSAPEVIRNSTVSCSADVFSFGVVMWEVLTWQQPYEEMLSVQVLFSLMQQTRPEVPCGSDLPGSPGSQLHKYIVLMEKCWREDAAARPTFEEVVTALDEMRAVDCVRHVRAGGGSSRRLSLVSDPGAPNTGAPTHCGTPAGSSFCGGSPTSSMPGSVPTSAPTSGGPSAAAVAVVAAHTHATAMCSASSSHNATSGGSCRSIESENQAAGVLGASKAPTELYCYPLDTALTLMVYQEANVTSQTDSTAGVPLPGVSDATNTVRNIRANTQSDPGTYLATNVHHVAGGSVLGPLGEKHLQLAGVGSTPVSNGSSSSGGGAPNDVQERPQHQQQHSLAVTAGLASAGVCSSVQGIAGSAAGVMDPNLVGQLSVLGPITTGNNTVTGLQAGTSAGRVPSRLGPTRTSHSSSGGARDAPNSAPNSASGGSALQTSFPLMINVCNSPANGQASPSPKTAYLMSGQSRGASEVASAPPSPMSPQHRGMSAYSPFAAASVDSDTGDADNEHAAYPSTAVGCCSSPKVASPVQRPASPFSAVQEQPNTNNSSVAGTTAGSCTAAASGWGNSPRQHAARRPASPFSAVQEQHDRILTQQLAASPAVATASETAATACGNSAAVRRPVSPFSAAQEQHDLEVE